MKFEPLLSSKFVKGTILVILGNGFSALINYLYHLMAARYLMPDQFGYLESFVSLNYFIAIVTSAFSLSIIYIYNKAEVKNIPHLLQSLLNLAAYLTLAIFILAIILSSSTSKFFNLTHPYFFIFFSIQILFSFLPAYFSSLLAAKQLFLHFSLISVFSSVSKLVLAWVMLAFDFKLIAALSGMLVPGIISLLFSGYWCRRMLSVPMKFSFNTSLPQEFWTYFIWTIVSQASLTALYTIDVLAVRINFTQSESGFYAAASVLARSLFFISSMVCSVAFPIFTSNKDLKKVYYSALLVLTSVMLIGGAAMSIQSRQLLKVTYGSAYAESAGFMLPLVIFMSLLGLYYLNYHFLLSTNKHVAIKLTAIAAFMQVTLMLFRHDSISMVIQNQIIILGTSLLISYFFSYQALYAKRN